MIGPKEKKERRVGERLHLKGERCNSPKCAMVRKPYHPGMHGPRSRRRTLSDFGRQLQEKQKFKLTYGLDERGIRRLFRKAHEKPGSASAGLLELLERRLDNVILRLGFAASRSLARQLIVHGHILVNQRKVRSPGYLVKVGDVISFREESKSKHFFRHLSESLKKYEPPPWAALDKDKKEGRILSLPQELAVPFDTHLLIESLSR